MTSPFDGSPLNQKAEHVYQDDSGGYLIINPAAIRRQFEAAGRDLNTREVKLENLGVFPLAKDSIPLLTRELTYNDQPLRILPLMRKSQIPIFSSADSQLVYIPAEGCAICRYFHELWSNEADTETPGDPVLSGFAILASYAGL